jgi:hypothetical protein
VRLAAGEPVLGTQARPFRATLLDAGVLCAIFAAGLAHLRSPFGGDQFLFLLGAQKIAHHGVMYRDFWDLKQPAVFYFYAVAGRLFGFTETGVHLFEALYQTLFAALLISVCAARFSYRWAASIVPLLTVGAYYGFASNYALTSVEAVAGLPIFIAAMWAADAFTGPRNATPKAIAAGAAGAVAAALKFAFLPLVAGLWIAAFAVSARANARPPWRSAALVGFGCIAAFMLYGTYFAAEGVLGVALRTALIDPPLILRQLAAADRSPFWPEARAFGRMVWPLAVLAAVGAWSVRRRADMLAIEMLVWTVAGCGLIAVQVWSYDYRFYIIVVPIGVLAARGLETCWTTVRRRNRRTQFALAFGLAIMAVAATAAVVRVQVRWQGWQRDNEHAAASSRAFLNRPSARAGPIYVFGDPRVYYFSGRGQAVAINGWSPQLLLPAQWHLLCEELAAAAPPYIMVERDYVSRLQRSAEMTAFIARTYSVASSTHDAIWYEHR